MNQATLSVYVDDADKISFEEYCKSVGINVSVAINSFIKKVIRERKIPFEVVDDPFYSEENMERLRKSAAAVVAGQYIIHPIIEVDEHDISVG